ncbi:MAG TPA: quinol:electron acceptor oxidoreductase subunit ActD [Anaerolineae bacterium]
MAGYLLLGVYHEVDQVADAVQRIRRLGVPENRITVMSPTPISAAILGRPKASHRVSWFALAGAVLGALTALFLVGGTQLLYPIRSGGQPLWPIPPQLIILFEVTMLGTMWATFVGFFIINRLPRFGNPINDRRIMAGHLGVAVEADGQRYERAREALAETGAIDIKVEPYREQVSSIQWLLWVWTVLLILGVAGLAGGLVAYDILRVPWFSQMVDQVSYGYEQGPRLAAPAAAVPVEGPVFIAGEPASAPVKADAASLGRGKTLFAMHCAVCHNSNGDGNGTLSGFFNPKPFNLTAPEVQNLSDQQIFTVISQGFGTMPSLREDLTVSQRWDVVNWVRTLKK